jgi:Transposase and inactivated derivatives, IS30 family
MKHLTYKDRLQIAELITAEYNVREMADIIGKSEQTIRREIKRGQVCSLNNQYVYSPAYAQGRYSMTKKSKRASNKS